MIKQDLNSYIEIRSLGQAKELKKNLKALGMLKRYKGRRILFIDKNPNYNNFNITQITLLFCQVGGINIDYFTYSGSQVDKNISSVLGQETYFVDKEVGHVVNYNTKNILSSLTGNRLNIRIMDINQLHKQTKYDLVICNGRGFSRDFQEIIELVKYNEIFYFLKGDGGGFFTEHMDFIKNKGFLRLFKDLCIEDQELLKTPYAFDTFQGGGYVFFSKIFSEMYSIRRELEDKKYDIVITGRDCSRDGDLIKYLLKKRPNITFLYIVENKPEAKNIMLKFPSRNLRVVINNMSYSNFFKYISLGKIYLNSARKGIFSNGITGLLVPYSTYSVNLTYYNSFFKKLFSEGEDGFFYSSYEECLNKIDFLLDMDENRYGRIEENKYHSFHNTFSIEDILLERVFSKLP